MKQKRKSYLQHIPLALNKVKMQRILINIQLHVIITVVLLADLQLWLLGDVHLGLQGLDPLPKVIYCAVDLQIVFYGLYTLG